MAKEWAKKFYSSKGWEACRNSYYIMQNGICEECGGAGDEVHHIIFLTPQNINDPFIALNHDNLKLLCRECHNKEHEKAKRMTELNRTRENRFEYDEEGNIIQSKVFIVWGCYGSGKSTYVKQHLKKGDLIIDLDLLGQAISGQGKTELPYSLLPLALSLRDYLYSKVEREEITRGNVYITSALPIKKEREEFAQRLNAELIYIDATEEECLRRVLADKERVDKHKQQKIIKEYFQKLEK